MHLPILPTLFLAFVLPLVAIGQQASESTGVRQPNIIWIMAEDISNELSCYGEPGVSTPNIDALASAGVRYERAYCSGPACSTSRSGMMSGVYQTRIDAHDHRRVGSFTLPAMTEYLHNAGYFSAKGCGYSPKTDLNFKPSSKLFLGKDWKQAEEDQPFFAQVTLQGSHRQDEHGKKWQAVREKLTHPVDFNAIRLPPYFPDAPEVREDWAVYLDQIQAIDTQVGQIISRLKSEGRYDDAMIIFCGDNGRCHLRGKNWLYEPGLKVPLIIKFPSGNRAGEVVSGMVSMLDVSATVIDFAGAKATRKLDGQSLRTNVTREIIFGARDAGGEVQDCIRSVCDGRFKLIRNYKPELGYLESKYTRAHRPMLSVMNEMAAAGKLSPAQMLVVADEKPALELYDLNSDPHEIHNLAESSEHKATIARLSERLDAWLAETKDTGLKALEP